MYIVQIELLTRAEDKSVINFIYFFFFFGKQKHFSLRVFPLSFTTCLCVSVCVFFFMINGSCYIIIIFLVTNKIGKQQQLLLLSTKKQKKTFSINEKSIKYAFPSMLYTEKKNRCTFSATFYNCWLTCLLYIYNLIN